MAATDLPSVRSLIVLQGSKIAGWNLFSFTPPAAIYFLDFVAYPILILVFASLSLANAGRGGVACFMVLAAAGYCMWTLAEYLIHRFVLHHLPYFRGMHEVHHGDPHGLVGTPTIFSVLLFLFFVFWPLTAVLGVFAASSISTGLLSGYFAYGILHYTMHHWTSAGLKPLRQLKRHHAIHHHVDSHRNYGVTTTIWDRVFHTLR